MAKCGYKQCMNGLSLRPYQTSGDVWSHNLVHCECDKGQHLKKLQPIRGESLCPFTAEDKEAKFKETFYFASATTLKEAEEFFFGHTFKQPVFEHSCYQGYDQVVSFTKVYKARLVLVEGDTVRVIDKDDPLYGAEGRVKAFTEDGHASIEITCLTGADAETGWSLGETDLFRFQHLALIKPAAKGVLNG